MTPARAIRILLAMASLLIVVWAFFDVTRRAVAKYHREHERPITLTILHWGDKAEDVIVQKLVDRYMDDHPNVHIIRINPSYGNFRPKLKTMMAAGTPPDVFYLPPDIFPELATQKLIRPIDDYIEKEKASGQAAYLDDFWPILMQAWHYDTATSRIGQGKLYGLPKDCTTAVMYINVGLFEKAGLDSRAIQKNGWTWVEFEAAMKKIRALSGTAAVDGRTIFGTNLEIWSDTLRNVIWTYGGEFFRFNADGSADFHDVTLKQPPEQEAMEMIRRMRLDDRTAYNVTGGKDNNDVGFQQFVAGNIGCDGPVGCWKIPRLMNDVTFQWDCVPIPYKEKRFQASQIYLTAWTMASKSPHPDECFKLIKFLCGPDGAKMQAHAGLAIPPLKSVANSPDFLDPPGMPRHNAQIFLDAIAYSRIQQSPRQQEWWSDIVVNSAAPALQQGTATTMQVAQEIERRWLNVIDSPLHRREFPRMRWSIVVWITIAGLITVAGALWAKARREKLGPLDRAQERAGFAFISPWLIAFFALTLGPMVVSLLLSFTKWSAMAPMSNAQAVGLANYQQIFTTDDVFAQSLKVTLYFVVLAVPISQVLALAIAVLMNSKVRGITIFRTIYFVPSVVSGVALAVLWRQIFNNDYGIMNAGLRKVLGVIGATPPDWFGRDADWWAVPAFVIMGLWGVGGGMIIYLAGLKGIPASMYEAATIDGASATRKFWNVTLPMLSPLIFYNIVMGIIGSFQIFTQALVMTDGGPNNATLFYVLNLYRQAFQYHQMGYASALAWVLFLIVLVLTIAIFRGSRSLVYYEGLKT